MVNKTVPNSCEFMNKEDILSDKDLSIYNAAIRYDPSRNTKFSTHLANETRWRCLNLYNKQKKMIEEPLTDSIQDRQSTEDLVLNIQQSELITKIINLAKKNPDKRVKKIIDMRYCFGYTKAHSWREISEKLQLSIQGCIDIHNKFIQKIKKEIIDNV